MTDTKNPIQVSERIFHTIECLAQNGAMGLQELSTALDLNKSTVHRILNSLICMDYVRQRQPNIVLVLKSAVYPIRFYPKTV